MAILTNGKNALLDVKFPREDELDELVIAARRKIDLAFQAKTKAAEAAKEAAETEAATAKGAADKAAKEAKAARQAADAAAEASAEAQDVAASAEARVREARAEVRDAIQAEADAKAAAKASAEQARIKTEVARVAAGKARIAQEAADKAQGESNIAEEAFLKAKAAAEQAKEEADKAKEAFEKDPKNKDKEAAFKDAVKKLEAAGNKAEAAAHRAQNEARQAKAAAEHADEATGKSEFANQEAEDAENTAQQDADAAREAADKVSEAKEAETQAKNDADDAANAAREAEDKADEDEAEAAEAEDKAKAAAAAAAAARIKADNVAAEATKFEEYAKTNGIGTFILKLTSALNRMRMDDSFRLMLATESVYGATLLKMLRQDKADPKDVDGLRHAVLLEVRQGDALDDFYEELIERFRITNGLDIPAPLSGHILTAIKSRSVPLVAGKTAPAIREIVEELKSEGNLRNLVKKFSERGEINPIKFTDDVKQSMVDYLEDAGVQNLVEAEFDKGNYDEFFFQAYHQAIFGRNGKPIPRPIPVPPASEEFRLPTYDFLDEQGVVPSSIHAAAALYQMYFIGDKLGLFELPNMLLLRRAHGTLDLPSGEGSQLLQAYKRLQRNNDDVPQEERMLLYERVFGLGGGKVLEDTAVNAEFMDLWDTLAREVTNYITRSEISNAAEERISRAAIEEAIQNIQSNLSFYAGDIDEDVRIMQKQYLLAEKVLRDKQIMASIGLVRRQTLQAAIERLASENNGSAPAVKTVFKLGTKGQEVLHFVADYDSSTPEDEFQRFLRLMEAWIVSRGSLKDDDLDAKSEESEDEDDFDDDQQDEDWDS